MSPLFLQLCDSQNVRSFLDGDENSLTIVLSPGSLKGGGKNAVF